MGGATPDISTICSLSAEVSVISSFEPIPGPTTHSPPPESSTLPTTNPKAQALITLREIIGEQVDRVKEVLETIFAQYEASRGQLSQTDVLEDLSKLDFLSSGDELIQFLREEILVLIPMLQRTWSL